MTTDKTKRKAQPLERYQYWTIFVIILTRPWEKHQGWEWILPGRRCIFSLSIINLEERNNPALLVERGELLSLGQCTSMYLAPNSVEWKDWRRVGCPNHTRWASESSASSLHILSPAPGTTAAQTPALQEGSSVQLASQATGA